MYRVEMYARVRRACRVEGTTTREASWVFGLDRKTVRKMLSFSVALVHGPDAVAAMIPQGVSILLAADRFYGTSSLIRWCQNRGWKYRIRLKKDLILLHQGGEITTGDAARAGIAALTDARLNESGVLTHIGILHENGHKEPWVIAMDEVPSKGRVLDYGMRWGIEPMFSDFKSRGFSITKTQLRHADRIEAD